MHTRQAYEICASPLTFLSILLENDHKENQNDHKGMQNNHEETQKVYKEIQNDYKET